jgi:hypothetical protein
MAPGPPKPEDLASKAAVCASEAAGSEDRTRVIVVGGGVAGLTALKALRPCLHDAGMVAFGALDGGGSGIFTSSGGITTIAEAIGDTSGPFGAFSATPVTRQVINLKTPKTPGLQFRLR